MKYTDYAMWQYKPTSFPGSAYIFLESVGTGSLEEKELPSDQPVLPTPAAWKAVLPAMGFCDTLLGDRIGVRGDQWLEFRYDE